MNTLHRTSPFPLKKTKTELQDDESESPSKLWLSLNHFIHSIRILIGFMIPKVCILFFMSHMIRSWHLCALDCWVRPTISTWHLNSMWLGTFTRVSPFNIRLVLGANPQTNSLWKSHFILWVVSKFSLLGCFGPSTFIMTDKITTRLFKDNNEHSFNTNLKELGLQFLFVNS